MAATGTIALNANSLTVTGSGTKFTTEAQLGGALVTYIGNVPYTFVVGAINSDTSITLTANHQGSNVSGQSFSLIDRSAYTAITAELGARTAQAIRGLNYDKANWQQILTGSGNVTVNVPDGSQYTGPSWLSLTDKLVEKAPLDNPEFTTDAKITSSTTDGLNEGGMLTLTYGGNYGWQYSRLYPYAPSGGVFATILASIYGNSQAFYKFGVDGNAISPASWVNTSDKRLKDNISIVEQPLQKLSKIRGVTWDRIDIDSKGIGFIAQSVKSIFPDSVISSGDKELGDGAIIKDIMCPDTAGVAAALHQEAILTLMSIQRKALLTLSDPSLSDEDKQSALKELAELIPDESEYADQ